MLKLSRKVQTKIVEPLESITQFKPILEDLLSSSRKQIFFLDKLSYQLRIIKNCEYQHLHEIVLIPKTQYWEFIKVINQVLGVLESIPRKKYYGTICYKKDNRFHEFTYFYKIKFLQEYEGDAYCFEVWEAGMENESKFYFDLRIMKGGKDLKVVNLARTDYIRNKGKRISIAMILESKILFKRRIISSSNLKKTFSKESRFQRATDYVWKKMEAENLAAYNDIGDYYYTL